MNTASLDIGDVRYPGGVWRMDVKLPGQGVVDHNRWLAAISTRPAPIADLGLDPGQPGQMRNAVGTTGLALIQKVIVQLAVAINLAALLPASSINRVWRMSSQARFCPLSARGGMSAPQEAGGIFENPEIGRSFELAPRPFQRILRGAMCCSP